VFDEDHESFRKMIRDFIAKEVVPVYPEWEAQGHPPREFYRRLGELGVLGIQVPEQYGGGGLSNAQARVLQEELINLKLAAPLFGMGLSMIGPTDPTPV